MTGLAAHIQPRERQCECGAIVLETEAGPLNLPEVFPEGPCGACGGRGHRTVKVASAGNGPRRHLEPGDLAGHTVRVGTECPDCGGRRVQGEPLMPGMVLMDPSGRCRDYDGTREPGECALRRHEC